MSTTHRFALGAIPGFGAELHSGLWCRTPYRASVPNSSADFGAKPFSGIRFRTPQWTSVPNSLVDFGAELLSGLRCRTPQWTSVPNSSVDFDAEFLSGDWRLPQCTLAFGVESFGACLTRDISNSSDCKALVC